MEILLLLFWGSLIGVLLLTLLLGSLTRRRWPMRLPLGLLAIPLAGSVYERQQGGFFWELNVLLCSMIGVAIFLGWMIGRALCRRKENTT